MSSKYNLLPFQDLVRILKFLGLWKIERSRITLIFFSFCLHAVLIEFFILLQVIFLLEKDSFKDISAVIVVLPTCIAILVKSKKFIFNSYLIEDMFESIQEILVLNKASEEFAARSRKIEKLFKIYFLFSMVACCFVILGPITTHKLPYQIWFPFTYEDNTFIFWLAAIHQVIISFYLTSIDLVFYTFPLIFIIYIFGMFEQLAMTVETLKRNKTLNADGSINKADQMNCSQEFIKIITCHQKVLELTKNFESFFSICLFCSGLQSTIVICTSSFLLTEVRYIKKPV